MLNIQFDGENICNPIDGQMESLIETFVAVHGEEKREAITERLNNATFLFLPRSFDGLVEVKESFYNKRKELSNKFFEELGMGILSETFSVEEIFYIKESFEAGRFDPKVIKRLDNICTALLLDKELRAYRCLYQMKKGYNQGNEVFANDYIASDKIKNELRVFFDRVQELETESGYRKKESQLASQYDFISKGFELLKTNREKLQREKNLQIDQILSEKVAKLLGRSKQNFEGAYDSKQQYQLITAYQSMITRGRENFSDVMTLTPLMKDAYIALFIEMGVYSGTNLNTYANNEQLMSLIYDESVKANIDAVETYYENKLASENPFFKDAVQRIEELDIKGGNMYIVDEIYRYILHGRFVNAEVMHYLTKDDKLGMICLLPLSTHLTMETFLHECEHIVESSLAVEDDEYIVKCGLESHAFEQDGENYDGTNLSVCGIGEMKSVKKTREMEVLNETFVQLFAYMLCESAKNTGLCVGSDEHRDSWHRKMVKLFNGFYDFSDKLSDVRLGGDRQGFEKAFGKTNCLVMNKVAQEYYELQKDNTLYRSFVASVKKNMGFDIQYVDFLDLPEDIDWSPECRQYLDYHILVEEMVQRLKTENDCKNKNIRQVPEEFSSEK